MSLARLSPGHAVAALAALALVLVMAMDWYGSTLGDEARRVEERTQPSGAEGGQIARRLEADARILAEREERNAWQTREPLDAIVLTALLAAAALGLGAAAARAADRRWPLSASAAVAAGVAAGLVAVRMVEEPGLDEVTTIKAGAPLALLTLGAMSLASLAASRPERTAAEGIAVAAETPAPVLPGARAVPPRPQRPRPRPARPRPARPRPAGSRPATVRPADSRPATRRPAGPRKPGPPAGRLALGLLAIGAMAVLRPRRGRRSTRGRRSR